MEPHITYTLATAADTDVMIHYRITLLDAVPGMEHSAEEEQALRESLKVYFPEAMANGSYVCWLAWADGNFAGISGMVVYDRPASYKCPTGRAGYILNMYTHPQYRKRGICSTLLQKLLLHAKDNGISVLALHASEEGEPVYRKHGFKEPASLVMEMRCV